MRFGPYEVTAPLGAGGMGEVYRARDTRLDRTVALKILKPANATDPLARSRFEREARAVAALDHPHICGIYDVGEIDGTCYLVMPLLDGQTLAQRLERGPLPLPEALSIASQIADALDSAHRQGIVHRDLKPANVMLTTSGVKLLDFGLAKLQMPGGPLTPSAGAAGLTTTDGWSTGTAEGTILGTIHYMAPEQVEGREVDARTDIWALGVVVYEMVSGVRPFLGATPASVIGAILRDVPTALSTRTPLSPPSLDRLVDTCLAKSPDDRWQTCRDLARELRWVGASPQPIAPGGTASHEGKGGRRWLMPIAVTAALLAGLALGRFPGAPTPPAPRDVRFSVFPEPNTTFAVLVGSVVAPSVTISPNGRYLAFPAVSAGRTHLWLRDLQDTKSRLLEGTDDVRYHFWSPDSRNIGFTARGKLKTVGTDGALPVDRATINATARGGTWLPDGSIVINQSPNAGLFRVAPDGGVTPVFAPSPGGETLVDLFPYALRDGTHLLFVHRDVDAQRRGLYLAGVDGQQRSRLVDGQWAPIASGEAILYLRGQTLVTQRLDLASGRLIGEPVVVLEHVANSTGGYMSATISNDGTLAYAEPWPTTGELAWLGRDGVALGGPIAPLGDYVDVRLSPTGKQLAFSRVDGQSTMSDIWLLDLARAVTTRLTTEPLHDAGPAWAPDGRHLVFRSNRRGTNELFIRDAAGSGSEVPLRARPEGPLSLVVHGDYVGDTDHLVVVSAGESIDILSVDLKTGTTQRIADSPFDEYHPSLSPDGQWLAFVSEETGAPEVYLQAFPGGDRRVQVSASGGSEPQWRSDGKELFYIRADRTLMSVPVTLGRSLALGAATPLFATRVPTAPNAYRRQYVAARDGTRFLVNNAPLAARPPAIQVVLDWRALVPAEAR